MDVKETLRGAKEKVTATVGSTVEKNSDKIESGIDKAADFVDEKTKGKYHDKIESFTGLAKDKLGIEGHEPPTDPPAGPTTGPTT